MTDFFDAPTHEAMIAVLEATLEATHDGLLVIDLDRRIRRFNRRFIEMFRVPDELAELRHCDEMVAFIAPQLEDPDAILLRSPALWADDSGESLTLMRFKDGRVFERFVAPQRIAGRIVGRVISYHDISGQRKLEEQLRQAQKLDAIGRLAGGIAHDLNNALTTIAGYTELALGTLPAEHAARADVQEIRRAAERAASITRQLLAFSRKQRLEPRAFDLNETVRDVVRLLERLLGGNVRLRTQLSAEPIAIHADPGQIEQAIINLAVNGRDAMPGGGDITIATALVSVDAPMTSTHATIPEGRYAVLSVTDTGHGMSAETLAHIFEPFFTTKDVDKGTGLGLSTVYGTVSQSGGFVWVDSEPYRGSTFTIYFPPATARPPAPAPPVGDDMAGAEGVARPASEQTILLVEDENAVRELIATALAREGYRVLRAASAGEALGMGADAGTIDLLLTDANMPGVSGVSLARILLAARPDLPVLVMSGFSEDVLDMSGLPPLVGVLHKPFTPKQLQQRIREVLGTAH